MNERINALIDKNNALEAEVERLKLQKEQLHESVNGCADKVSMLKQRAEQLQREKDEFYALADERANFIIGASNVIGSDSIYARCKLPTTIAAKQLRKGGNDNEK